MRHYYDVYALLQRPEVQAFIGTEAYTAHKAKRFRGGDNPNISQNEAFILAESETRKAPRHSQKARRSITVTTRPLSKSTKRLANGSTGCEGLGCWRLDKATSYRTRLRCVMATKMTRTL
jgi:hypothetical protein